MIDITAENCFYKCCWAECGRSIQAFSEYREHWKYVHILSEKSMEDVKCQISFVRQLEVKLKTERNRLLEVTTKAGNYKNVPEIGWINRQEFVMFRVEETLKVQKDVLSTMLTHLHFYESEDNMYYSAYLSLQNMKSLTQLYNRNTTRKPTNNKLKISYKSLIVKALLESETGEMSRREISRWIMDYNTIFKEMETNSLLNTVLSTLGNNPHFFSNDGINKWRLNMKKIKGNKSRIT